MDGAALDRPRPHQRHLHGEVVERLRQRPREHLHLRPALDLEDAGGVGAPDRVEGGGIVDGDPREVHPLAAHARDLVDAPLDRRQHPEPQQVDLEEPGVRAGVLVPLHDLAALHRRRLDGADVDEGPRRQHHPARMLGGVAGEPPRIARELGERTPARRGRPRRPDRLGDVGLDRARAVVDVHHPRRALDLARRQPQHLPEVAHRPARAIGGERAHQRRSLVAVALDDPRDQHLADVARKVEVDVGSLGDLLVQEAPEEQPAAHGVDVREPGEVADHRADARPAPAPRRQQHSRRVGPPHLDGHLARQLEDVVVQEKEARELELADHGELLFQAPLGLGAIAIAGVAMLKPGATDLRERPIGIGVLASR